MRIKFIWPNYNCPLGISIGISYISSCLKKRGHQTSVIHINESIGYCYNCKKISEDILKDNPDLVIFSTGENHFDDMCDVAKLIKSKKNIPILFGGVHITLQADKILENCSYIDFLCLGDGEEAIPELVDALEKGLDISNVANIFGRYKGYYFKNFMRKLSPILSLPKMDLSIWDFQKITKLRNGWVNISVNRGCPFRCSFCHNEGVAKVYQKHFLTKGISNSELSYLRYRKIEEIIDELEDIQKHYDFVTAFSIIDDTFTMNKKYSLEFLKQYKKRIKLPFVCLSTVNNVDEEILNALKNSGCDLIRFGVETATDRIKTKIINRNFSNEKIKEVFSYCRRINLRTFSYNIIGHPTETKEEILKTFELNAQIMPSGIRISLGYPYPGTKYYDIAEKMKLIDHNYKSNNYLEVSRFKWSDSFRLWLDKTRTFYWWYLNSLGYFDLEVKSSYKFLINKLENLSEKEWCDLNIRKKLIREENVLSETLKTKNFSHYSNKFPDRLDIVILNDGEIEIDKEVINGH
ncbi:MAG: B12-binding domain-containing radical SAM protein [Cetobacterium sp.]|uniref:B12-binding domain-containing radical SAM protein n=1 Tax=Cetobacterium sp. TaxID=2071632 RepID=UPI003EE54D62